MTGAVSAVWQCGMQCSDCRWAPLSVPPVLPPVLAGSPASHKLTCYVPLDFFLGMTIKKLNPIYKPNDTKKSD